jgi:hypothetical protein
MLGDRQWGRDFLGGFLSGFFSTILRRFAGARLAGVFGLVGMIFLGAEGSAGAKGQSGEDWEEEESGEAHAGDFQEAKALAMPDGAGPGI